jgi:hypothetical protein
MPLQDQVVAVSFDGALDTKSDPKQLAPGQAVVAENVIYSSPKRFRKRPGGIEVARLPSGVGMGAVEYGSEHILSDGDQLWSQITDVGVPGGHRLVPRGTLARVRGRVYPVARSTANAQTVADGAYAPGTGREVFVWEEAGTCYYRMIDAVTRVEILSGSVQSGINYSPRITLVSESTMVLSWIHQQGSPSSQNVLNWAVVDTANPSVGPTQGTFNVLKSVTTSGRTIYDVFPIPGIANVVFAYELASTSKLAITIANSVNLGQVEGINTSALGSDITRISAIWDGAAGKYMVIWGDKANTLKMVSISYALVFSANVTVSASSGGCTALSTSYSMVTIGAVVHSRLLVVWTTYDADPTKRSTRAVLMSDVGSGYSAGPTVQVACGVTVASRGIAIGTRVYYLLQYQSSEQSTYFLGQYQFSGGAKIVARLLSGLAGPVTDGGLPSIYSRGTQYAVALLEKTSLSKTTADGIFALSSVDSYVFETNDFPTSFQELGQNLIIRSGDMLQMYDGESVVEQGFHLYPERVGVPDVTGTAHTYQYVATY